MCVDTTESVEHGADAGLGNLLGIQPAMSPADYASADALFAVLAGYLDDAGRRGWIGPRTIAVFPEYIGTWLVIAGESRSVQRAQSLKGAMARLALAHPFALARSLRRAAETDKLAAALFRIKAAAMARDYGAVFSRLAARHGVTIVAGSIILPAPHIEGSIVLPGDGPLQNVSTVYRPDGQAHEALARKAYPLVEELHFLSPAPVAELPVFDTPAGRLGVLVCADSWYPAPYERLRAQGVELVAVPSFLTGDGVWDRPWRGYNVAGAPSDVDPSDALALTEGQAWRKHALARRIARSGARHGINVFLRGALWDLGSDGLSLMVSDGVATETGADGAALLNLWLPGDE